MGKIFNINGLIVSTLEGVGKIINKSVTLLSHMSLLLLFRSCLEFETCDDVGAGQKNGTIYYDHYY